MHSLIQAQIAFCSDSAQFSTIGHETVTVFEAIFSAKCDQICMFELRQIRSSYHVRSLRSRRDQLDMAGQGTLY